MDIIKMSLKIVGVFLMAMGWVISNSERLPLIEKHLFPKYHNAMLGAKKLSASKELLPGENGFKEISEFFINEYIKPCSEHEECVKAFYILGIKAELQNQSKESQTKKMFEIQSLESIRNAISSPEITRIEFSDTFLAAISKEGSISGQVVSKTTGKMEIKGLKKPLGYQLQNLEEQIRNKYRTSKIIKASTYLFWTGFIISVVLIAFDMYDAIRKRKRSHLQQ